MCCTGDSELCIMNYLNSCFNVTFPFVTQHSSYLAVPCTQLHNQSFSTPHVIYSVLGCSPIHILHKKLSSFAEVLYCVVVMLSPAPPPHQTCHFLVIKHLSSALETCSAHHFLVTVAGSLTRPPYAWPCVLGLAYDTCMYSGTSHNGPSHEWTTSL